METSRYKSYAFPKLRGRVCCVQRGQPSAELAAYEPVRRRYLVRFRRRAILSLLSVVRTVYT